MNTQIENQLVNQSGERLISKQELACRLKKSLRTISKWQRCGIIPFVKCRRAVFYDWHSVLHHLQQREKCQAALHSVPADVSPQVTNSHTPYAKGPVRLPVYQMRDEKAPKRKCRGLTSAATKDYENQNNIQT